MACAIAPEPAVMHSDELVPTKPWLEDDAGPDGVSPWARQVLMETAILQVTPRVYVI